LALRPSFSPTMTATERKNWQSSQRNKC
jgi:hypothetical protein